MPLSTAQDLLAFEFCDATSARYAVPFEEIFAEEFGGGLIREPLATVPSGVPGDKGSPEVVMCLLSLPMALHASILLLKELVLERRLSRILKYVQEHHLKVRIKKSGRVMDLSQATAAELRAFLESPDSLPAVKLPERKPK